MKRFNLSGPQDFMALMVRRKWWILIPFLAIASVTILMIALLPRMYVSEAVILIRPRDVPKDFVKDLISGSTAQRVMTIQQIVLSRSNLSKILDDFEADFPEYQKLNSDQRVAKMRRQIAITFQVDNPVGKEELPLSYFRIAYRNGSPAVAQKITERLADLFIQEDNKNRESQVSGTTEFLQVSLDEIAVKLKESDTKYKILKASRGTSLPDQFTANLDSLRRLEDQRRTDTEALDRATTNLSNVERQLDITPKTIEKPVIPIAPVVPTPNPNLEEYKRVLAQLRDLAAAGRTGSHPDVIVALRRKESLTNLLTPEDIESIDKKVVPLAPPAPEKETNPVYERLMSERNSTVTDKAIREKNLAKTIADIAVYRRRVDDAPASEQAIAEVARENDDLNRQYKAMNDKLNEAKLSESAESSQKGSQFVTSEHANYPLSPTKPAKAALAGIGVMLSLFGGIAFGIAVDFANQKMWTLSDVETLLGTTVLVEIPEIITEADLLVSRKKKRRLLAALAMASAAYAVCLYMVYLNQSFVLRQLDPVLQRLY